MLVLTRRPGQTILIGEGKETVRVTYKEGLHGQIKIGITAPKHIRVDREEVRKRPGFDPNKKPNRDKPRLSLKKDGDGNR